MSAVPEELDIVSRRHTAEVVKKNTENFRTPLRSTPRCAILIPFLRWKRGSGKGKDNGHERGMGI